MSGFRIGTINRRRADTIIVVVHESTVKWKTAEKKQNNFLRRYHTKVK